MAEESNKYYYGIDLLNGIYGTGGTGGIRMININGQIAYPFNNATGNIEALFDDNGNLLAEYEYTPFGNIRSIRGSIADKNPMRFSSRYYEGDTNLYYYSYRHYCPSIKKWLSQDPIGEQGGINLYNFVGNNPIMFVDLFGYVSSCSIDIFFGHGSESGGGPVGDAILDAAIAAATKGFPQTSYRVGVASCYDKLTNLFNSGNYGYPNPYRVNEPSSANGNPSNPQYDSSSAMNYIKGEIASAIKVAKESMCNKPPSCCKSVWIRVNILATDFLTTIDYFNLIPKLTPIDACE